MSKKLRITAERTVRIRANARYEEGDTVDTPAGVGVVVEVITEPDEDADIDASQSSPTYAVVVESEDTGVGFYKASDLSSGELPETDVDNPEGDLAEMADNAADIDEFVANAVHSLKANQDGVFQWPESWRESDTPARIIALKAWAGMNGSVSGCIREMRGNVTRPGAFCADFADRLYGTDFWRGDSWAPGA